MARLRVVSASREQVFTLTEEFTVGRLPSNTLPLPDDKAVSREHAVIRRGGEGYLLKDLDSSNGTFLERGDQKWQVSGEIGLLPGDIIQIGGSRLSFEDSAPVPQVDSAETTSVPGQTVVGRVLPVLRGDDAKKDG